MSGSSRVTVMPSVADRLADHLADLTVPLVPKTVTPNQITIVAFAIGIAAAFSFYMASFNKMWLLSASAFLVIHIFLDCLDGAVARQRNQTSKVGAFLDLFLDCITFILVPVSITYSTYSPLNLVIYGAIAYPMHSVLMLQWSSFTDKRVFPAIGPTDVHFGYVWMAMLTFFWDSPVLRFGDYAFGWFDLIMLISIPLIVLDLFRSAFNLYRDLRADLY